MLGFFSYGSGSAQGLPANFFGGEAKLRVLFEQRSQRHSHHHV
jgi:hypothetical protein